MLIDVDDETILRQIVQEDILNLIDYGGILVDEKETVKAYLTVLDYNMPHSEFQAWLKKHDIKNRLEKMDE